jgi:flagellar biogenesis protein FliO
MEADRVSGMLAESLEGPAMDRRLPASQRYLCFCSVPSGAALWIASNVWAADPESRAVPLPGSVPSEPASGWIVPLLVCVAAAVIAAVAMVRRLQRRRSRPDSAIEIVDRAAMGRGRGLALVRVGDRVVLVGESSQGFQRLAEFSAEDPVAVESPARRIAS